MKYTYVLYVDVLLTLLMANLVFDYLLLWATGSVTGRKSTMGRLCLGAAIGTVYFFLVYFSAAGLMPGYGVLKLPPVILAVGALMLWAAYSPRNWRQFLRLFGYLTAIGLIAGGAGLATAYAVGTENRPNVMWGTVAAMTAILLVAELGWGVVHRRVWERLYLVPLQICLFGRTLNVNALIDTGNRLQDPLSGRPVVIVELDTIKKVMPSEVAKALGSLSDNNFAELEPITEVNDWASRFCLVPFTTLADRTGLMAGIKPDYIKVSAGGESVTLQRVILGICLKPLDQAGNFHALIPPEILGGQSVKQESTVQPEVLVTQKGESVNA